MRIQQLAYARSSDKGDDVDITLFAYTRDTYRQMVQLLTSASVHAYLAPMGIGTVERYEVAGLLALKFVVRNGLDGGGARSIRADNQGKTWSGLLLRLAESLISERNA